MKKLFLLFVLSASFNTVPAQEIPPPDFDAEIEAQRESAEVKPELPFPDLGDEIPLPDKQEEPDDSTDDRGVVPKDGATSKGESKSPPRSHSNQFQHLSELPGQYQGDWLHLVKMKFVWKELELVTDQRLAIDKVIQELQKQSREILREKTEKMGLPHELQERLTQLRTSAVTEIREAILLPEQVQRLREIEFQLKMKSRGVVATLKDESLGLDVREDQVESIETKATELAKEYELLMRSFKLDFRDQILDQLDDSQRAKVEKLMGREMQVMDDKGDGSVAATTELKEAAMAKLKEWRSKQ